MVRLLVTTLIALFAFGRAGAASITTAQGLSHNGVTSIIEDSRGYLWIATYEGLNRYNGKDFTLYRNSADSASLLSNRVRALCEDSRGRIWVGTESGVMLLDDAHNRFLQLKYDSSEFSNNLLIKGLASDSNDRIIAIAESGGVALFNLDGELLAYDNRENVRFNSILAHTQNIFIITSDSGLWSYDSSTREIKPIEVDGKEFNERIESICKISQSRYAVTLPVGVAYININSDQTSSLDAHIEGEPFCSNLRIKALYCDRDSTLWLGTYNNGVARIKQSQSTMQEPCYVTSNMRVSGFFEGANHRLWVSTFDKGVVLASTREDFIEKVEPWGEEPYRTFRLFALDSESVAVKAENKNYIKYNINTKESTPLLPKELQNIHIHLSEAISGGMWGITKNTEHNIIYKIDNSTYRKIALSPKGIALPCQDEDILRNVVEDSDNNLWLAYNSGLYRARPSANRDEFVIEAIALPLINKKTNILRSLYIDPKDASIWSATSSQGLYHILNPSAELNQLDVKHYAYKREDKSSLPSNWISCVARSVGGVLLIGSGDKGLFRVDEEQMTFVSTLLKDYATDQSNILAINIDQNERAWITTNNGLYSYNLVNQRVHKYNSENGLPVDNMLVPSAILDNGTIVYAGVGTMFTLDSSKAALAYNASYEFHFGDLRLYNDKIELGEVYDDQVIMNSRLKSGDLLNLEYDQNTFSVDIDVLHYNTTLDCMLRYKMLPNNDKWIELKAEPQTISFNGLPHGEYQLVVQSSSSEGEWGNAKVLNIEINPPLWLSWWAYAIYILFALGVLYVILVIFIRIERLKNSVEMERRENENMKEKQRYFSNIAHEIKTPLSLVVAPISQVQKAFAHDASVRNILQRALVQSRKISYLVDVAQGIQLSDAGLLTPNNRVFDFNHFMDMMLSDFHFVASSESKELQILRPEGEIVVKSDDSMLEKIFNNLLNNAFKYTAEGAKIVVQWHVSQENIIITVSDNGIGIGENDIPYIFDRFYRGTYHSALLTSGTGIGLSFSRRLVELLGGEIGVESTLNEKTEFKVTLPIVTNDEITEKHLSIAEQSEAFVYDDMSALDDVEASRYPDSMIYIVEDNHQMRMMLESVVGRFYKCRSFANGEDALQAVAKEWPDLILSDLMMPIMNGYQLCQSVKEDIRTSHIPIILLSGCLSYDERIECKSVGADLYLTKPFYPKYLVSCIETILDSRAKFRDRYKSGIPMSYTESDKTESNNKFLERFFELVTANIDNEDIDFDLIAREIGVNRTHFYQKIKTLTGQTPMVLVRTMRLSQAAELLATTDKSIEEICLIIGFKNRTHFSRLFKAQYGVSPGKYHSSLKGEKI